MDQRLLETVDGEAHIPVMFSALARRYAAEGKVGLLARKAKTVSFTDGEAAIDDDVLVSCLDSSTLKDTSDTGKLYSWRPHLDDVMDDYERRLGYYFMLDSQTLGIIEPDEEYDADSGLTGSRRLTAPCVWDIPTDYGTEVSVSQEVAGDMIEMLAESIRGQIVQPEAAAA